MRIEPTQARLPRHAHLDQGIAVDHVLLPRLIHPLHLIARDAEQHLDGLWCDVGPSRLTELGANRVHDRAELIFR
jgi:hypothetical protein